MHLKSLIPVVFLAIDSYKRASPTQTTPKESS